MKLSDLKTGMWVKTRNGEKYLVLRNHFSIDDGMFIDKSGFLKYGCYNDDMSYPKYSGYDIIEVFKPDLGKYTLNGDCLIPIWERRELPKLTSFEKEFFKALKLAYKNGWIARDNNGLLYVYDSEPIKGGGKWAGVEYGEVSSSSIWSLFSTDQFAWCKWEDEEPWYIPDLLKEA